MNKLRSAKDIQNEWDTNPRWKNVKRDYTAEEVVKLSGSVRIDYSLAKQGAEKLWKRINNDDFVNALGALTGNQALQQAKAGLKAVYLSGWQVAGDANTGMQMYPDQSLYPVDSVPAVVKRINNSLRRADQLNIAEGNDVIDYMLPIVADAEAGFGGVLNAFELMKAMIEAGAAGVHFEDQLASAKKCGHMGGKVLVPTQEAVQKLAAARLAADISETPTVLLARTDAEAANLLTSDVDSRDKDFCTGERTAEGFYRVKNGIKQAISRGLSYAPYADLVWCETGVPDLDFAKKFAEALKKEYPEQLLAYNCSPSFNWKKNLNDSEIASFQEKISEMGYKYQFITLAGIHNMWYNMFDLAYEYAKGEGMKHYVEKVQEPEFNAAKKGYTFASHQQEVGAGYFDDVTTVIQGGESSVTALKGSTEEEQFS